MGSTVIDYVIGDEETKESIRKMRIGDKVDSDHHPLEIWVGAKGRTFNRTEERQSKGARKNSMERRGKREIQGKTENRRQRREGVRRRMERNEGGYHGSIKSSRRRTE